MYNYKYVLFWHISNFIKDSAFFMGLKAWNQLFIENIWILALGPIWMSIKSSTNVKTCQKRCKFFSISWDDPFL